MEWLVWLGLEVGAYETGITGFLSSIVNGFFEGVFGIFFIAYEHSIYALIASIIVVALISGALEKNKKLQSLFILSVLISGCFFKDHYVWGIMGIICVIQELLKKEEK